jgi:hypothetical protein
MARLCARGITWPLVVGIYLASGVAHAGPTLTTTPATLIAGETGVATIEIKGLPLGEGAFEIAVNVGKVLRATEASGRLRLRYALPTQRHPQRLCLLLWRKGQEHPTSIRVPLLGRTSVPIRTRPRSQVTFKVGTKTFGPQSSGKTGRLSMAILVAPGLEKGRVVSVDAKGLRNEKLVPIATPAYNQLAMLARKTAADERSEVYRVAVASSEPTASKVALEGRRGGAGWTALRLVRLKPGQWTATLDAQRRPTVTRWQLRATNPAIPSSSLQLKLVVEALASPSSRPLLVRSTPAPRSVWQHLTLWSGVGATVALAVVGVVTGQLASDTRATFDRENTGGANAMSQARRDELDSSFVRYRNAAIGCFVGAGVVAIGTALYYWLGFRRAAPERRRVSVRGAGLVARW